MNIKVILLMMVAVSLTFAGTMKDSRDGKTYKTVKIGGQTWMAENLNHNIGNSWCYDNKPANCKKYGRLYTWDAAMEACPSGWHLPSRDEFEELLIYVDPDYEEAGEIEGKALMSKKGWSEKGTDKRGFSALPAGAKKGWSEKGTDKRGFSAFPAGEYGSENREFVTLGSGAFFWSSSGGTDGYAELLCIMRPNYDYNYNYAVILISGEDNAHSIRCLQD